MPSKLVKRCRECKFKDTCENKVMEQHGYINPSVNASVSNNIMSNMRKVDLRDIKIDANTTVTVDMEELKEHLKQPFSIGVDLGKKEKRK